MGTTIDGIAPGAFLDGKYRIEKLIGAGGMGTVYEATHTAIGRRVAIKRLHHQYAGDAQAVERFQREARMAGSIGHDNICEVTDLGTTPDGAPYLVMPLLTGCSLTDLLSRERLSLPRIADIMCQTLSALQAAHDARIVHRDLKPDNLFITKVGDRGDFVKLLDFGISKILDQDSVSNLTMTGTVLGTPFYMAPEQATGSKQFDHRVDIYAIGAILYEALTGRRPFEGDSYNEIMFKIVTEPFPSPRSLNPKVPVAVEQVVLKAMARDPAERYASARDMRDALSRADLDMSNMPAEPITRAATAVGACGPFTPTGVKKAATPPSSLASGDLSMDALSSGRGRKAAVAVVVAVAVIAVAITGYLLARDDGRAPVPAVVPLVKPQPSAPATPSPTPRIEPPPALSPAPPPVADTAPVKKPSKVGKRAVKGRFGTKVVSDYEE
ncbi:MAG: serine/threonine-protein kinase [Deltaproteobacteria bacterium]|nr:serine/threonine-protein kinase [Deltaproteobacteria bacterium]